VVVTRCADSRAGDRPQHRGEEIVWQLPGISRIHQMLRNPMYAGALAYGRTKFQRTLIDGRLQQTTRSRQAREDWSVLLRDHHAGYISWGEYCKNQQILEANLAKREANNTGAAKSGPALLSGLLRCGGVDEGCLSLMAGMGAACHAM